MRFQSSLFATCCAVFSTLTLVPVGQAAASGADEAALANSARVETIVRLALERNPALAETRSRALAAEARSHAASRLPDPELKYEQWGVPLAQPLALSRADTLMLGVRQTFPAWGTLDARGRATAEEAASARDNERARHQEVVAQVLRAYAAYYRAEQELRLHREHVGLMSRVLELARLNQRTGHGGVEDVVRLEVELTRLHTDVARIQGEHRSSGARLNSLMARPLDAPLGPPEEIGTPPVADMARMEGAVDANRPEIAAAGRAVRRTEASLDEMRRAARIPSVMVGLDYWYMPMGVAARHAYGAMVSMNLPWLYGRRRDEEKEAAYNLQAEQQALESTRNTVRFEVRDAGARLDAARESLAIIDEKLLAQARRGLDATEAAYASGQGDAAVVLAAMRSYLEVRVERVRALAEVASTMAELQRAAGMLGVDGGRR